MNIWKISLNKVIESAILEIPLKDYIYLEI